MPPRSPLPPRHGLQAAWVRTRDRGAEAPWPTMRDFLLDKLGPGRDCVDPMLARGEFVDEHARPISGDDPYRPNLFVFFHRTLRPEAEVPGRLEVLHRDDRIVVFDKPHFLSTIPRGRHVLQSAVVKGREATGLPELSAAHRLDRGTAGVLLMTTERRWRRAYQEVFARREVTKTYEVIAPYRPGLDLPRVVRSHLVKRVGVLQAETLDLPPNSETHITLAEVRDGWARYVVRPVTGRTHQIRAHFNQLGLPLLGDPLYPEVRSIDIDDFSTPLRLLARELRFTDPIDGTPRVLTSRRDLEWPIS